ncbi:hypothetical protein NC652_036710 [Populus alba x Populus x berolinensis]|nr:hypothetical protein NC652_036710 [Populus alba x Populus x berolinensis]
MCKAPHWLVSFPFFCEGLRFLSTWGVPLGGLALQSLWLQPLSVMLLLLFGFSCSIMCELFSLRMQEVIECLW